MDEFWGWVLTVAFVLAGLMMIIQIIKSMREPRRKQYRPPATPEEAVRRKHLRRKRWQRRLYDKLF